MSDLFQAASNVPAQVASFVDSLLEIMQKRKGLKLAIREAIKAKEKIKAIFQKIDGKITEAELSEIRLLVNIIEIVCTEAKKIAQFYCDVNYLEMEEKFEKIALDWENKIIDLMRDVCRLMEPTEEIQIIIVGEMELSRWNIIRWTPEHNFTVFAVDEIPGEGPMFYFISEYDEDGQPIKYDYTEDKKKAKVVAPAPAVATTPVPAATVASSSLAEVAAASVVDSKEKICRQHEVNLAKIKAQWAINTILEILTRVNVEGKANSIITCEESAKVLNLFEKFNEALLIIENFVAFSQQIGDIKASKHWEDIRSDYLQTYCILMAKHLEVMSIMHVSSTIIDVVSDVVPAPAVVVEVNNVDPMLYVEAVPPLTASAAPAAAPEPAAAAARADSIASAVAVDPILYAEAVPTAAPAPAASAVRADSIAFAAAADPILYAEAVPPLTASAAPAVAADPMTASAAPAAAPVASVDSVMANFSKITKEEIEEIRNLVARLQKNVEAVKASGDAVALQRAILASLKAEAILAATNAVHLWQDSANAQGDLWQISSLIDATEIAISKFQQVAIMQHQIICKGRRFASGEGKDINFWEIQQYIWDARLKNLLVTKLAKELALGADQTSYIEALKLAYEATKKVVELIQAANFGNGIFMLAGANSQEWQQFLRICQQQVKRLEKQLSSVGIKSEIASVPAPAPAAASTISDSLYQTAVFPMTASAAPAVAADPMTASAAPAVAPAVTASAVRADNIASTAAVADPILYAEAVPTAAPAPAAASTTVDSLAQAAAAINLLEVTIHESMVVETQEMRDIKFAFDLAIKEAKKQIKIAKEIFADIGGGRIIKEKLKKLSDIINIVEVVCKKAGEAEKIHRDAGNVKIAEIWEIMKLCWRKQVAELNHRLLATVVPVSSLAIVARVAASTASDSLAQVAAPASLEVTSHETRVVVSQEILDIKFAFDLAIKEAKKQIKIAREIFANVGERRITKKEATELSSIIEIIEVVCKKAGEAEKIHRDAGNIVIAATWETMKLRWQEKVAKLTNRLLATVKPVSSLASLAPAPAAAAASTASDGLVQAAAAAPVRRMQYKR